MVVEGDAAAVELKGIVKRFGKLVAVQKMDLRIPEGSLVTLLGPSGCGKTTILRIIAGLEQSTEGDIYIRGERVNDTPVHKRNIGMIFQNYSLFPHKTIFNNVGYGLKYRGFSKDAIKRKVDDALKMVRLTGVEDRMPSQLSGGQQQRVALARAIVIEPDVLLMDEPLSALDEKLREEMRREIANIQKLLGITTIFVTHDQREALSMSDKIVVMKDGEKQQEGSSEHVYNYPVNHFVADFLGHSNFFEGIILDTEGERARVKLSDGNEIKVTHRAEFVVGEPVELFIRAQRLKVKPFNNRQDDPDINIFEGTIKDRSYMGGEVSYFVELTNGTMVHAIGIPKITTFRIGDKICVHVDPGHCGVLKKQLT